MSYGKQGIHRQNCRPIHGKCSCHPTAYGLRQPTGDSVFKCHCHAKSLFVRIYVPRWVKAINSCITSATSGLDTKRYGHASCTPHYNNICTYNGKPVAYISPTAYQQSYGILNDNENHYSVFRQYVRNISFCNHLIINYIDAWNDLSDDVDFASLTRFRRPVLKVDLSDFVERF